MQGNDKYLIPYLRSCLSGKSNGIALKDFSTSQISYNELLNYCFEQNPLLTGDSVNTYLIAVFGDKTPELVKYIYGIIASGNAYLPLDFYAPPERLWFIIQNAGVKYLLLEKSNSTALLDYLKENCIHVTIEDFDARYLKVKFNDFKSYPPETAYVLYTSGSTGNPKGVVHTHKSALTFINWFNENINIQEGSNFLSISPFSFDVAVPDIFSSIRFKGTLIIPQFNEIANFRLLAGNIQKFAVNFIYSTPSFFNALNSFGKLEKYNFSDVSCILFAGEQLYGSLVLKMKNVFKNATMYNFYGPTETNVVSCFYINSENIKADAPVPIGKVCEYATSYLVQVEDDNELCISSDTMMAGYVDKNDCFMVMDGKQYYNTGDVVSVNENGDFVFKCRRDRMIKRNGFRIEIGEIENVLQAHSSVFDFAVKIENDDGLKIRVYYVGEESVSELELKNYFLKKLPAYMLPDSFNRVESIAKNINFKVDLNKL